MVLGNHLVCLKSDKDMVKLIFQSLQFISMKFPIGEGGHNTDVEENIGTLTTRGKMFP